MPYSSPTKKQIECSLTTAIREPPIQAIRKNPKSFAFSSIAILAIGAWLASYAHIQPRDVFQTIGGLGFSTALYVYLFCFVQILFIVIRHGALIPHEFFPGLGRVVYAVSVGHAMNMFLPARTGDLLKCLLLSTGKPKKIRFMSAAGAVVTDRIIDIGTLFLMAVLWKAYRHPRMQEWTKAAWEYSPWLLGIAISAGVILVAGIIFGPKMRRAEKWGREFRLGLAAFARPLPLISAIACAFIAWSAEVFALQVLATTQGLDLSFGNAIFVILALNAAISFPISIANVGPFEAAMVLAFSSFGLASSQALAIATVHHAVQLLAIGSWAWIGLTFRRKKSAPSPFRQVWPGSRKAG